jgi:hypothetical protein
MLVHRATEDAFRGIGDTVAAYRDHWFGLVADGIPDDVLDGLTPSQIAARDVANRAIVFDPSVDPVWARVTQLVGDEQSEAVRSTLAAPLP